MFHQNYPTVLMFDHAGKLVSSWNVDLTEGHGITLVEEEGKELLWIADPGRERRPENGYQYSESNSPISGQMVKLDLECQNVMSLTPPDLDLYQWENY